MSRFACGILPLEVGKGRYVRKNREERVCKTCSKNVTEDKAHFRLACKALQRERKAFYKATFPDRNAFKKLSAADKLKTLLSEEFSDFAGWLVTMYQKRQSLLHNPLHWIFELCPCIGTIDVESLGTSMI